MNLKKGISPVIATVIIVAVAVAISIAVVGWIMGLWGSIAGGTESLKAFPDSYINTTSKQVLLHVQNVGSAAASIYRLEVTHANGVCTIELKAGHEIVLNPGVDTTINITITTNTVYIDGTSIAGAVGSTTRCSDAVFYAGTFYTVKLYTRAGNTYTFQVSAK